MANPLRQQGTPLLIQGPQHAAVPLEPVPLGNPPFREGTLQTLLRDHPAVLPVAEIEPAYAPLIYLGREIKTSSSGSGYLDVLYVSPAGYLTLVEAKLWDNPQARREVVGQIVEYAKDLSRWTFEDLNAAVRKAGGPGSLDIVEIVRKVDPDLDEAAFVDTVTRQLHRGAFLLLVVGNGIREGVETLTAFLQQTPSLHFSLALVELALYRTDPGQAWPLLVQPRTVARTAEVIRAVVEVRAPPGQPVKVMLPQDEEIQKARKALTEDEFFKQLTTNTSPEVDGLVRDLVADLREMGVVAEWRAGSVSMRLRDPGGTSLRWTVIGVTVEGSFWFGWMEGVSSDGGYDPEIWRRYLRGLEQLTGIEAQELTKYRPIETLFGYRAEFLTLVRRFIEDLQAAARKREV